MEKIKTFFKNKRNVVISACIAAFLVCGMGLYGCSYANEEVATDDLSMQTTASISESTEAETTEEPVKETETKPETEATAEPTVAPTAEPTAEPTAAPTEEPVSSFNGSGTYSDNGVTITVNKEWYGNAYVYAAHVTMSDYSRFRGEYLGGQRLSKAASRNNAILAINGDWASPNGYTEIRGGNVVVQSNMPEGAYSTSNGLLWYAQNGYEGATETFCFGPAFLMDGNIVSAPDNGRAQRTFIGTNGNAGDLWLCVSDGRHNDGESAGLTPYQCAEFLKSKGCTFGVPLDGGGSSEMIFQGEIINSAKGNERSLNDALYILP